MGAARTLRIIRVAGAGDVMPGDFVRLLAGRNAGWVESVTDGHALVISAPGHRSIIPCAILRTVGP